jgi:Smg protein
VFEILVYLVENYFDDQVCPDPDALELKLKAAGFDGEDISDALAWLAGLAESSGTDLPADFADRPSFRSFASSEEARLSRETRGFLAFLESSGVIDAVQREQIIERSLALPDGEVDVEKLKIITLVVLWSSGVEPDALVFDELLPDGAPRELH